MPEQSQDACRLTHATNSTAASQRCGDRLHCCVAIQCGDEQPRARSGCAASDPVIVRQIVMTLLRLNTTCKASSKSKRMLAFVQR